MFNEKTIKKSLKKEREWLQTILCNCVNSAEQSLLVYVKTLDVYLPNSSSDAWNLNEIISNSIFKGWRARTYLKNINIRIENLLNFAVV